MSELKNCPFCGGKATVEYDLEVYAVVCRECGASSRTEDDWHVGDSAYADVVAAWNRRADHLPDATKMVSNADRIRSMSIGEAMNCPKCNSANIYTPAENLFICNRCGHEWQAEVEGRAVVLPCKVGDTVYAIVHCDEVMKDYDDDYVTGTGAITCPFEGECMFDDCDDSNEIIVETCVSGLWCDSDGTWKVFFEHINADIGVSDFGKTVFLTRAAAEQAKGERK